MTSTTPEHPNHAKPTHSQWTFLTNHTHVLLAIARDHDVRLREIASQVGITERAVQKIIAELEESGILSKSRDGRRNHYEIDARASLRHPMEAHRSIAALLEVLLADGHSNGNRAALGDTRRLADGNALADGNGHAPTTGQIVWHRNGDRRPASDGNGRLR